MRALAAIVSSAILAGCTLPLDKSYTGPKERSFAFENEYSYVRGTESVNPIFNEHKGKYGKWDIQVLSNFPRASTADVDPSTPDYILNILAYVPYDGEKLPAVICASSLDSDLGDDREMAEFFAERGYASFVVNSLPSIHAIWGLSDIDEYLIRSIIDYRRAVDYIEEQDWIDQDRISIVGMSMGGINSAFVAGIDERVDYCVSMLSGGNIDEMMIKSPVLMKHKMDLMKVENMSAREINSAIRDKLRYDPLDVAPQIDARKTLMILAVQDGIVPFHEGMRLRKKIGRPETIILPSGHFGSVLFFRPYMRKMAYEFLERKFKD